MYHDTACHFRPDNLSASKAYPPRVLHFSDSCTCLLYDFVWCAFFMVAMTKRNMALLCGVHGSYIVCLR